MCMSPNLVAQRKSGLSQYVWPLAGDSKTLSLTSLKELSTNDIAKSSTLGTEKKINGTIVKVKITIDQAFRPVVPVLIPDLDAVRAFAQQLHERNEAWQGEAFGWEAEYNPFRPEPPLHAKMAFTPADFWIGDATIWGFSMMWEHGDDHPPAETVTIGILSRRYNLPRLGR